MLKRLGASSDFQKATKLAYNMVAKWGMSDKVGKIHLDKDKMSDEQRRDIDSEVKELLNVKKFKFCLDDYFSLHIIMQQTFSRHIKKNCIEWPTHFLRMKLYQPKKSN